MTNDEFNPYRPPTSDVVRHAVLEGTVWREGRRLVMERDAELPTRCIRCNAPGDAPLVQLRVRWTIPGLGFLMLGAFLALIVLASVNDTAAGAVVLALPILLLIVIGLRLTYRTVVEYGLCSTHRRIQRFWRRLAIAALMASIALIYAHIASLPDGSEVVLTAGLAVLTLGILARGIEGVRQPRPWRFNGRRIWLTRCGKPFLDSLPPRPTNGLAPENGSKAP